MVLSADHKTLFVAGTTVISSYDVDSGKEAVSYPCTSNVSGGEFDPFRRMVGFSAAVTPDGKTLAVPDQPAICFWDVASAKEIPLAPGHRHRIDSVSFGPVGQILSTAADGKVLLWDAATATIVREFTPAPKADKGEKEAMTERRGGGQRIELYQAHALPSPDGKSVFGHWWGSKVHIWDLQTGKLKHLLGGTRPYCGYHFSPDGKLASLVALDGTVELWDTANGRELRSFGTPPMGAVNPAEGLGGVEMSAFGTAISPDRRLVISGGVLFESAGLKARVVYWELASGQERMRFRNQRESRPIRLDQRHRLRPRPGRHRLRVFAGRQMGRGDRLQQHSPA